MLFPLLYLSLAVLAFYLSQHLRNEALILTCFLGALICLFLSLVLTPWFVKLLILIAVLIWLDRLKHQCI